MGDKKNNWFYIKNFKINSLFWRTFLIIAVLLLIPFIAIGVIFYSNILSTAEDEIILENSSKLDNVKNVVDNTLNECDMLSSYIASNDHTQPFMLGSSDNSSFADLTTFSSTIPLIYEYIDSVYIYSERSNSAFIGGTEQPMEEIPDDSWLDSYEELNDRRGVIIPRQKNGSYPPLITIIKPIYVADEKMGAVIMNINSQKLYRATVSNRYSNGEEFFMLDSSGRLLMASNIAYFDEESQQIEQLASGAFADVLPETFTVNGEEHILLYSDSGQFTFRYIGTYPISLYADKFSTMRWQIIIVALMLLVFGFILAYIASVKSYSPLREIITFLDTANPADNMTSKDQNELIYIINSIKLHIEDKKKMEEILEERIAMLKKSQYEMLQAQINPHFLYNTLETINWMAYQLSHSENPVSEALVNLANFFRNALPSSGYLISIEEEIKYTKDYINILNLRYGDLFDIEWDIDPAIMSCTIIKICLQPVIENAVYHGFKPKGDKGLLVISGIRLENNIILTVKDDGIGMEADEVDSLNQRLQAEAYNGKRNIGLANVNKRIKIIFGKAYGIKVESTFGKGTCVYITIPATE